MLVSIGLICLGLLLLLIGGELLLRGAVGLATLLKLTPAVIGLTVVAAGTSVPELAVSAMAAARNEADIAVANVVGSNIFNIAVIVGLCALIRPLTITGNTIKLEYPVLVLVTLLCLVVAQDGTINRLDGVLLVVTYIGFTAYLVSLVRSQVTAAEDQELTAEVEELTPEKQQPRGWVCWSLLVIGIILLAAGANATVSGAVDLARLLGWSERLIGLTIVSIGTGLPEVAASVVSSVRGRTDIAMGNVIGSNLFNILGTLGSCALAAPLPVQPALFDVDSWVMLGITLLLAPIIISGFRVARWEGASLLTVYAGYMGWLLTS